LIELILWGVLCGRLIIEGSGISEVARVFRRDILKIGALPINLNGSLGQGPAVQR
jgi:hypothetical protein